MNASMIDLHIEEIVLHGFPTGEREAVAEAVRSELSRLFAEHGIPPSFLAGGRIPSADGGAFTVAPGAGADRVGAGIAGAVHGGLKR